MLAPLRGKHAEPERVCLTQTASLVELRREPLAGWPRKAGVSMAPNAPQNEKSLPEEWEPEASAPGGNPRCPTP